MLLCDLKKILVPVIVLFPFCSLTSIISNNFCPLKCLENGSRELSLEISRMHKSQ